MRLTKSSFVAAVLLAFYPLKMAAQATNDFITLHVFSALTSGTNADGADPYGGLVFFGRTAYGTTYYGGTNGNGTIFRVNLDGSGFTTLHNFSGGIDGAAPAGPLALSGNILYGTASSNGAGGFGVVFSINVDGSGFRPIYSFTDTGDGAMPVSGVVVADSTIYGTTEGSGVGSDFGTVFQLTTNGDITILHPFTSVTGADGAYPLGPIVLSGNVLYGATVDGGGSEAGTVFDVQPGSNTSFMTLSDFSGINSYFTNATGANPYGGVTLSGSTLYGTTFYGGAPGYGGLGWGTVFAGNISGGGFAPIYSFNGSNDFGNPRAGVTVSGNMLYGATPYSIFALTTSGDGFTNFFTNASAIYPNGGLVVVAGGGGIYGTTYYGGAGTGTVFALDLSPVGVESAGGNVILIWNNPASSLQAAPAVGGVYTTIPGATSPYTNAITGPQMFFRLAGN